MQPKCRKLVKKVVFRTIIYIIYCLIGAILFVLLEQKQIANSSRSTQLLSQLHKRIELDCGNMSVADFTNFATAVHEAVSLNFKADWNYIYAISFVYQATTTIGELHNFFERYIFLMLYKDINIIDILKNHV